MLELQKDTRSSGIRSSTLRENHSTLIDEYVELIKKWDRVHSLVSHGDLNHLEKRHVADSLMLEPFLKPSGNHLDIGSGSGFPGVPLAICRPDVRVVLNDRSANKCRFLREVKFRLKLTNIDIFEYDLGSRTLPRERYDTISVRAVAPPEKAWSLARPLLRAQGLVLLHTHDQCTSESKRFAQGIVRSRTQSVRGWITAVALSDLR